jgi:ABC-type nitrate/sulfonate/bicarbonate transport system permease component
MTATLAPRKSAEEIASARPAWQRRLTSDKAARFTFYVCALLFWVVLAGLFERIPGPPSVIDRLVEEFRRGEVFGNFADTFYRFGIGVALSIVVGILVGVAIGLSPMARAFLESPVMVALSIPAIMWAFLTVMWFGFGHTSPIVTTFLTAVPFMVVNVAQGVLGVSRDLRDMSSSYGVPMGRRVKDLVLPAVMGYVMAGIRFVVIMGWNGVLLAEWFGGSGGAGYRARYWYDANQFAGFAAWVVLFVGVIIVLDQVIFERLSRRAFRWRDASH